MAKRKKTTGKKQTSAARKSPTRAARSAGAQTSSSRAKKTSSSDSSRKTMIIVIASVAVVVLLLIIVMLSSEDNRGDTSSTGGGSRSSVTVQSGALVNGALQISSYSLAQSGFITVHLALSDGSPGVIVGRSELLTGQGSSVSISIGGNQRGKPVVVGAYYDNGDGRFTVTNDQWDGVLASVTLS